MADEYIKPLFIEISFIFVLFIFVILLSYMGFLDIVLGGFLLYGFGKGLWKGLFVELASLVSLIFGIYIAIKFSYLIRQIILGWVSWNPKYIEITAFSITFILVVIGIIFLAKFFTTIAEFASLGWLNRIAGGVFGILKIVIILSIILHYFQKLNYNELLAKDETINKSWFFNPILAVSTIVFPMIEESFADKDTAEKKS